MRYVLYHSNCYDGFGAAYAAWKALGNAATYIPVSYGYPPPEMPDGEVVYILDFSYPKDVMLQLCEKFHVVVLDHHKTAQANFEGLSHPNLRATFDMNKSGAMLAWEYFHRYPEPCPSDIGLPVPAPKLIEHIQDRDLWLFKLDGSAKIHKALVSYPMDFELWDKFDVEQLKLEGETCERLYTQLVNNICKKPWKMKIGGYEVPVVNTSIAWSEVGDTLVKHNPDSPFVASFTQFEHQIMFSLRSRSEFDVSEIAKLYGGGGHKNAAGFKVNSFGDL